MKDNTASEEPKVQGPFWNKQAIAEAEIKPLIEQMYKICKREGIPMLCSMALIRDEVGTGFSTTATKGMDGFVPAELLVANRAIQRGLNPLFVMAASMPSEDSDEKGESGS